MTEANREDLNLNHPIKMFVKIPGITHQMLAALHKAVDGQKKVDSGEYFGPDKSLAKPSSIEPDFGKFVSIVEIADAYMDKEYPHYYTVELVIALVVPYIVETAQGRYTSEHLLFPSLDRLEEVFRPMGLLPETDEFEKKKL